VSHREKILILDDRRMWLRRLNDILAPYYDLTLTQSNNEAIKRVANHNYVLVILDMKLAYGATGLDVLVRMRKRVPSLRAIILTAYDESSLAVASLKAGALDYITKGPQLATKLLASINKHKRMEVVKVFLSYDRTDFKTVSTLHRRLTAQGFVPWLDRYDIRAGRWEPQIKKAIKQADFFVPCLSNNSVSNRGFIRKELSVALARQDEFGEEEGFIIPARLSDCEIPRVLKEFQVVSLFKDHGFERLVKMLMSKK